MLTNMNQKMKNRYRVFRRGWGTYYCEDLLTKKQETLRTCDRGEASRLGGSQTDVANLTAEDIDWSQRVVSYFRRKTGSAVLMRFGEEGAQILNTLPASGKLFPRLAELHEKHRAKLFRRRCLGLGIDGISLHSYRYAWAERARVAGYPERFAQEALGHNCKAVHRAYAKKAQVTLPPLEEYERQREMFAEGKIAEPAVQIANT